MSKSIGRHCLLRQSRMINLMMIGEFFIVKLVVSFDNGWMIMFSTISVMRHMHVPYGRN